MKRLISWLLALTLICGLLPLSAISAFAAPEFDVVDPSTEATEPDFTVDFGELTKPEEPENPLGSYENPYILTKDENVEASIPAGEQVYVQYVNDENESLQIKAYGETIYTLMQYYLNQVTSDVEGNATLALNNDYAAEMGTMVTVLNPGETDVTVYLSLAAAAVVDTTGTDMNPAILTLGQNMATIAAGNQTGYYFQYTATATGTLALLMDSSVGGWMYSISNLTTYKYYDTQWSDSNPVANPAEIFVAEGDVLQIVVSTYDPANEFEAPAGQVLVEAFFKEISAADLEAGEAVKAQIEALAFYNDDLWVYELNSGITYKEVEAARAAYEALNGDAKAFASTVLNKLTAAEYLIDSCDAHDSITGGKACEICGRFSVTGANMNLGNELTMNFAIKSSYVTDTGSYALISLPTKDTSGKYSDVERKVSYEDWDNRGSILVIPFNGIAARQMADELTVTIYDSNDNVISIPYTDSVRNYVMRNINGTTFSANMKVLAVDMLNYGAAAQNFFTYNTGDLANSLFTDAHKALATTSIDVEDGRIQGTNYKGTNLDLGSKLVMQMAFSNAVTADMYAVATFTKYDGSAQSVVIKGSEFDIRTGLTVIPVAAVTVPDASQLVTVVVYDSTGNEIGSATDSIASYIARQANASDLYIEIMKFATSAREYFLNK